MPYNIEIRHLATIEIIEAYDWYEIQKTGLGADFLDELSDFYDKLLNNPEIHSYYDKPVREGKINRFPYTAAYEVFDDTIVVYSVFMNKQNPAKKRSK